VSATQPPIDCRQAMRQLWDYLDGELTPARMDAVREHLHVCAMCYPHYEFEKQMLEALSAAQQDEPAPGDVRARVMSKLREAGWKPE
jgi:anti-sigma factor (TIGR02949 family)